MKKLDVITIGSALRDVMFYSDQFSMEKNPADDPTRAQLLCTEYGAKIRSNTVYFEFGGGAANTAVNFSGLGLKTGILTSLGDDLDGRAIIEQLKIAGVSTSAVQSSKKFRTGFSFLAVDDKSGEHVAYVYYGAAQDIHVEPTLFKKHKPRWIYIASLNTPHWKSTLRTIFAQSSSSSIAWNPGGLQLQSGYQGLKSFIKKTDVLMLNADEATELTMSHPDISTKGSIEDMMNIIHTWGPRIVVITNAREGSFAYDGKEVYSMNTPNDKPKDTTGAGDCYGSAFVAGLIKYSDDIPKAMKLATVCATALVKHIGAQNGLLTIKDLPKSLQ